jgi:hypothetical protein
MNIHGLWDLQVVLEPNLPTPWKQTVDYLYIQEKSQFYHVAS